VQQVWLLIVQELAVLVPLVASVGLTEFD
jgi:hypothetical protein